MAVTESNVRNIIHTTIKVHRLDVSEERVAALAHQAVSLYADAPSRLVDFLKDELRKEPA